MSSIKITVPELIKLAKAYYSADANNCCGGNLHIVLDDGNIRDSDIRFCLKHAKENGDSAGMGLAKKLLLATKTQRKKLYGSYSDYAY